MLFLLEIANLCEKVGANVDMVRMGIGSDERIGKRFLFAGIGYGGSCFPKDVQALFNTSSEFQYDFQVLSAVMNVNAEQKLVIYNKIMQYFDHDVKGKKIAVWGLAFKPDTDDIREAPALYIIEKLLGQGAQVVAYDPEAMNNVSKLFGDKIVYAKDQYEALDGVDALLIATEWAVFRTPEFDEMNKRMKAHVIFDGRNLYEPAKMKQLGYYYNSIGRNEVNP